MVVNNGIGTRQESSLHVALKEWYTQPGDHLEEIIDGFVVDIVRGDLLIEVQINHFGAIKNKLMQLLEHHPVRVVHPVPQEKWISRISPDGKILVKHRKSPKQGQLIHLFNELVRIPELVKNPGFSLEILIIQEEDIWRDDGKGSWRRKYWSIYDRRLITVVGQVIFKSPIDYRRFIPHTVPDTFTCQDISETLRQPRSLISKMMYSLRNMGIIEIAGKRGHAFIYRQTVL
jgi:hypothetical protein